MLIYLSEKVIKIKLGQAYEFRPVCVFEETSEMNKLLERKLEF